MAYEIPKTIDEAVELASRLMESDPENCKQGYTLENAAIAVADVYGFDREQIEMRLRWRAEVTAMTANELVAGWNVLTMGSQMLTVGDGNDAEKLTLFQTELERRGIPVKVGRLIGKQLTV